MASVIRIVSNADGKPTGAEGLFVQEYSPDGYDGRGDLVLTSHLEGAKRYDDAAAALADYRAVSETHPTRPSDGRPNRPMTAWTVEVFDPDKEA